MIYLIIYINLRKILRLITCVGVGSLAACQGPDQGPTAATPAAGRPPAVRPEPRPVAQQLGKSDFWLSLPATYALKTTDGPDFLVYYFAPVDTTVRTSFTGGLYFGGYPQGPDSRAGCQRRRVRATVLGQPATFVVQRCATGYTLNAFFASRSGQPWNPTVHAFGAARSAAELRQLLAIFATLRHQAPPAAGPRPSPLPTR